MSVRVRFAPSPTGRLHLGGARTALFNWLFAKKQEGQFILRIEDTDRDRHEESSIKTLLSDLKWLGLSWDEGLFPTENGIETQGDFGPYRQTQRLALYKEQAQKLLQKGRAYYCFLKDEEIARQKAQAKQPFRLNSPYRDTPLKEAEKKLKEEPACIRFKSPKETTRYTVDDLVRGTVTFPSDTAGDFILIRSDGLPVYNFSCAVDDALMEITHIFRGEEHLSNTVKQIMIQKALDLPSPKPGHLSIILGKDKKKLSKREGADSLEHLKGEGFIPQTLRNFLALLGWNPGTEQEYFSTPDLIRSFSTEGLNSSPAVFDRDKLLWLNGEHIKQMESRQLYEQLTPFLKRHNLTLDSDPLWRDRALNSLKSGFKTLEGAVEILKPLSKEGFALEESARAVLKETSARHLIERWISALKKLPKEFLSREDFEKIQKDIQEDLSGKNFFMPLRCALLGKSQGMEIKLLVTLLSRDELIRRASEILKLG